MIEKGDAKGNQKKEKEELSAALVEKSLQQSSPRGWGTSRNPIF